MNELEKITAAQGGDTDALAQLLHEHYLFVFKYLLQLTLHRQTAEDLTQETMIRAIQKIRSYNTVKSKFTSWLMTIGTRLYLDERRRRQLEKSLLTESDVSRELRWQARTNQADWSALLDALARLPSQTRAAVILKHYYGYSYDEIAQMLTLHEGTVKSRVHSGLKALRKEWGEDEAALSTQGGEHHTS
ncbi:RNA polymerase sigma factor SigY [Alicyclobacillus sp. ALC3]|uniref:RNA polymerase sigma factor SigY n=1 Tax=Alicyclobacillus sp. ALC3 TaxID=2796143 RepID=UPI0023787E2C|nr:RNA polymerase sigma factor SigY [Alicyclobacillus sp. ALC3]WDL98394.1 RNA polymerase sigma factor SigY [Alicyclobacillus sp. ALC3]